MLGNRASRYQARAQSQTWLNLSAWALLSVLGMMSWVRKDWLHQWLASGKAVHESTPSVSEAPANATEYPDFFPFPLRLPGPEQLAVWRQTLLHWGPIVAVWSLLGVAALGTGWLLLTMVLRLVIFRPRSAGRFTFNHAQEMAVQTLLILAAMGILAAGYFVPLEYLSGVIPVGMFLGFCAAVPGEKGWYTWGRLFGEWRDDLRWARGPDLYSIPYEPPPSEDVQAEAPASPQMQRLRKRLEKVDAQVNHKSTHPNQREAARHARKVLVDRITALEEKNQASL